MNKVHIVNKNIFTPYQLYVALSRAHRLKDITLEAPITKGQLTLALEVVNFYNNLISKEFTLEIHLYIWFYVLTHFEGVSN